MKTVEYDPIAVLIVDDDPDAQVALRDVLELDGCDVELASSIAEVTAHGDLQRFPLIVLEPRREAAMSGRPS